jgi:glycine cleavage system H protein
MNIPAQLRYTAEHEWIQLLDDGTALIGITDYAQSELGELVYVSVDTVGDHVDANAEFGTVEAVKITSALYAPVAGTVLEFNSELDESKGDNPMIINSDPYGAGWIIKLKPDNPDDVARLLDAAGYEEVIG